MMRILPAIILLVSVVFSASLARAAVETGDAPEFSATALDGKAIDSKELRGKVVLVDFWATWCVPCRKALPFYAELAEKHGGELVIVAVSIDTTREIAAEYVASELPMAAALSAFTVVWNQKHPLASLFGPATFPTSYLIDREGVVRQVYEGFDEDSKKRSAAQIETLISNDK
jgi:thiol-disulfide isomerase/thioredoxin